jgi:hypothetical protein
MGGIRTIQEKEKHGPSFVSKLGTAREGRRYLGFSFWLVNVLLLNRIRAVVTQRTGIISVRRKTMNKDLKLTRVAP